MSLPRPDAAGVLPSGPLRIGLVQLDVRDGDPNTNLARARQLVDDAKPADLYVLPELFTTGYAYDVWDEAADRAEEAVDVLRSMATNRHATVAAGMIARNDVASLVNRLWVVPPGNGPTTHYDKGHLFPPLQEDRRLAAGDRRVQVDVAGWRIGLSICFDLRFPEMYRRDALDGCHAFLVVSEWPAERAGVLRSLARARAAENQLFLALCNRTGTAQGDLRFGGGSAVIAPDGEPQLDAGRGEGIAHTLLHPAGLRDARAWIDLLDGRRPVLDW